MLYDKKFLLYFVALQLLASTANVLHFMLHTPTWVTLIPVLIGAVVLAFGLREALSPSWERELEARNREYRAKTDALMRSMGITPPAPTR